MDNDIVDLAKKLIAVPSVSGDIEKAVTIMKIAADALPTHHATTFSSQQYPSLLYSNKKTNTNNFKVLLNAHLDVVPASPDKFVPFEKDGKLYGRGAFDMKAGAAVEMLVFKELANKVSYPLGLQLVADEETSGLNGTGYQVDRGVRGDFIVIGECNSNFKVGNKSKGRQIVKITVKGKASHSAYSWLGKNAIWRMYEVLDPIVKAYPIARQETYKTVVNITKIEAENKATNKIPDICTAYIDIRYSPEDKESVVKKIKSLLPADVSIEVEHTRPYHFVDPENNYIKSLRKITKDVYGKELPLRFAHATSDATFFTEVGGDAIEFGPVGENAHQDNEYVEIKSLSQYYKILKKFLLTIDKN